jgi:hypothetical protein
MTSVLTVRSQRASHKMLHVLEQYKKAFPNEASPLDPARVAIWGYETGIWHPIETDPREVLRRKLVRALRHEYMTDPQGREVHANFSAVEEVMTSDGPKRRSKFYGAFQAPPEVARQALALDRKQALNTVQQMKLDFDSYNDNNAFGATLDPLDVNFQKDLDEMSLPDVYDPELDDEEDDD